MMLDPPGLRAVESFAAQLGLPARPAADGSFGFVFARTGTLTVTPAQGGRRIVVSLARKAARVEPALLLRLLGAGGHDPATGRLIHAGLAPDDEIHLALSFAEADFDLPALDAGFQQLAALHDRLV
jgi:type III secretion system chaperone SycN